MLVVLYVCLWTPGTLAGLVSLFEELYMVHCSKEGKWRAGSGLVSSVGRWEVELEVRRAAVREGYVVVHGSSSLWADRQGGRAG